MMGQLNRNQGQLFYSFCLDEAVLLARADEVIERSGASSSRCSAARQGGRWPRAQQSAMPVVGFVNAGSVVAALSGKRYSVSPIAWRRVGLAVRLLQSPRRRRQKN
jgi:hypothetical protein